MHNRPTFRRNRRPNARRSERPQAHRLFSQGRGGHAVRRGNVRLAILSVLQERPMHGYQIIQELEGRTQGRWRPSAGSVYPTLQLLEEKGMLTSEDVDGRRTYSLTDTGREAVEKNPRAKGLFEADASAPGPDLRRLATSLIAAARQVDRVGTPEDGEAARQILADARRRLYRLLAEEHAE